MRADHCGNTNGKGLLDSEEYETVSNQNETSPSNTGKTLNVRLVKVKPRPCSAPAPVHSDTNVGACSEHTSVHRGKNGLKKTRSKRLKTSSDHPLVKKYGESRELPSSGVSPPASEDSIEGEQVSRGSAEVNTDIENGEGYQRNNSSVRTHGNKEENEQQEHVSEIEYQACSKDGATTVFTDDNSHLARESLTIDTSSLRAEEEDADEDTGGGTYRVSQCNYKTPKDIAVTGYGDHIVSVPCMSPVSLNSSSEGRSGHVQEIQPFDAIDDMRETMSARMRRLPACVDRLSLPDSSDREEGGQKGKNCLLTCVARKARIVYLLTCVA